MQEKKLESLEPVDLKGTMHVSDIAIRRPVFTTMVAIGLVVVGIVSFFRLQQDLFPPIDFPIVTVNTVYMGAGPEEVETLVSRPLEDALSTINGLEKVKSVSREGLSTVIVQFTLDTDIRLAAVEVREKVSIIRNKLPREILEPTISRVDFGAAPVLTLTVEADRSSMEIRRITEDVLKLGLESVDGVGNVNVVGGLEREIQVNLSLPKLQALGMSADQVFGLLSAEGLDAPSGRFTAEGQEVSIRAKGQFTRVSDIGEVMIPVPGRAPVKLAEIASIEDGHKDYRTRTRINGKPGVTLDVIKASGANTVEVSHAVMKKLNKLEKMLPADFRVTKLIDSSEFIEENTHEVNMAIFYGGLMAILVIYLFMLDWRSTFISALALPTSVITTFTVMYLLGFTLNMMSLMALSLAIGLLIDDAVVVRENIFRHMEMGYDPVSAASKGTKQIALAVFATTFTIVAVFVPVAFTSGIVGQFFRQFGLTITAAVLVSMFVAFTLDPMLSARLVKQLDPHAHEKNLRHPFKGPILRFLDDLDAFYRRALAWALKHKVAVAAMTTGVFLGSIALVPLMGTEFQPKADRGMFTVMLEMPAGTSIDVMDQVSAQAETFVAQNPYVLITNATIGTNGDPSRTTIKVVAVPKSQRTMTLTDIREDCRTRLSTIPDLKFRFVETTLVEGMGESPVNVAIQGDDFSKLLELSEQVKSVVHKTPGTTDVDSSYEPGKPEVQIKIDRARAGDAGVSMAQLARGLRIAIEGDVASKLRDGEKDYDIRVRLREEDRNNQALLETYTVPARSGRQVQLREVAEVVRSSGPALIEREQRRRLVTVTAGNLDRSVGEVIRDVQKGTEKIPLPDGYSISFTGEAERMRDMMTSLGSALALAIVFIYLVLASQFESFVHPFTIMVSLPLAVVGALVALFVVGAPLGMPIFIGVILLMGLVTKNAILLVDYANQLREERGYSVTEALLEAGPTRLRPILMTSLAMVLGMLPTAISQGSGSEFRSPMAIAIIGGVLVSTMLTLVVVPIVYTLLDKITWKGLTARREAKAPVETTQTLVPKEGLSLLLLGLGAAVLSLGNHALAQETRPPGDAAPAASIEIPPETLPIPLGPERALSLEEALAILIRENPDVATLRSRLEQARLVVSRARIPFQPIVMANGNYTRNGTETTLDFSFIEDAVNGAVEGAVAGAQGYTDYQLMMNGLTVYDVPSSGTSGETEGEDGEDSGPIVIQPYNAYGFSAVASWNILSAKNFTQLKGAKLMVQGVEQNLSWATWEMMFGVTGAFYNLVALQQVVGVSLRQLESQIHHLELTRARFAAGQVAQTEVFRAEVEVVKAERQLRDANQGLHNAAAELSVLLGLSGVELRAVAPPPRSSIEGDLEALLREAMSQRMDMKAARSQLEAAKVSVTEGKVDFLPTLGIQGIYRWANTAGFSDEKYAWSVTATASLPVWDGGLRLANLRDAQEKYVQAENAVLKLETSIRKEVAVASSNLEQARIGLRAAEEELKMARLTSEQMEALFEAGRITSLEVRDTDVMVMSAEFNKIRADIMFQMAVLSLERALGRFTPPNGM